MFILIVMNQRDLVIRKLNILLLAIRQFKNTEQTADLINIIEKELNTILVLLDYG